MRRNKNMTTLDISTKVQIWAAMMARSLKSCLTFSIEFRLQSAHPASQPPDDLEIVRLKRPEVRGQRADCASPPQRGYRSQGRAPCITS